MACNTCVSGTPTCPYCGSVDFAPLPAPSIKCHCNSCNRNFLKPYCMSDIEMAAAAASGKLDGEVAAS